MKNGITISLHVNLKNHKLYAKKIIARILVYVLVCNKECVFDEYLKNCTCMKNAKSIIDKIDYCFNGATLSVIMCLLLLIIIAIDCYYYYNCTKDRSK